MTEIAQIKPCPFCGGTSIKGNWYGLQISCPKCHVGITITRENRDDQNVLHKGDDYDGYEVVYQAIKIWNARAETDSLITTIESQQLQISGYKDVYHNEWLKQSTEKDALIESQKEEIEKLNEVIRTLGLSLQNTCQEGKNK